LKRDRDVIGYESKIESDTDEIPKGNDELRCFNRTPSNHIVSSLARQSHLLDGAKQDDIGQRCLDCIAHAARAIRAGYCFLIVPVRIVCRCFHSHVFQMPWIDRRPPDRC
jgi:hypothetical protein